MKNHDIDTAISDLTELFHMINRKSHDRYITSMKQYIVNPLAWLHAEKTSQAKNHLGAVCGLIEFLDDQNNNKGAE